MTALLFYRTNKKSRTEEGVKLWQVTVHIISIKM